MHMVLFGIMDFLDQRILKGPLVSGPPGAKHFSLPFLPPCSFPFWPPLFYSILFYSSPPHPQPILPVLIPGFFDGRWFLGLSCQNWEEKRCHRRAWLSRWLRCCWEHVCVRVCMFVCMCTVTCLRVYVFSEKIRGEVWKPPAGDHSPGAMETKVVTVCHTQRKGNGNFSIMLSV